MHYALFIIFLKFSYHLLLTLVIVGFSFDLKLAWS